MLAAIVNGKTIGKKYWVVEIQVCPKIELKICAKFLELVSFGSEKLLQFFKSLYLIPLKLLGVAKYKLINIFLKPWMWPYTF